MDIKTLKVGAYRANCYIVSAKTGETFIVDPGADADILVAELSKIHNLKLKYILLTHAHFDHVGAINGLHAAFPDTPIYLHEADFKLFYELPEQGLFVGEFIRRIQADLEAISDGEYLPFDGEVIKVLHTPGHTQGSVSYLVSGNIFTGDTLFFETIGRTDLPYSNEAQIKGSLRKLMSLGDDIKILPGHGRPSSILHERTGNLHLKNL